MMNVPRSACSQESKNQTQMEVFLSFPKQTFGKRILFSALDAVVPASSLLHRINLLSTQKFTRPASSLVVNTLSVSCDIVSKCSAKA